jgi:hypothetical protein
VSSSANICGIIYSHSTNDILAVNIAYLPVTQSSFKEDNFNWRDLHLFYFEEMIPSCSHNHKKKPRPPAWYSTLLGFHNKSKDIFESELKLDLLFGIEEESVEDRGAAPLEHCTVERPQDDD